jgi:hypothetical protein
VVTWSRRGQSSISRESVDTVDERRRRGAWQGPLDRRGAPNLNRLAVPQRSNKRRSRRIHSCGPVSTVDATASHHRGDRQVDTAGGVLVFLHDPVPTGIVRHGGVADVPRQVRITRKVRRRAVTCAFGRPSRRYPPVTNFTITRSDGSDDTFSGAECTRDGGVLVIEDGDRHIVLTAETDRGEHLADDARRRGVSRPPGGRFAARSEPRRSRHPCQESRSPSPIGRRC